MKQLICAIVLATSLSVSARAQSSGPAVIALLNKASWCTVCKANGPRFEKEIMPMVMGNKAVQMVMNDLSDGSTKAASAAMLENAGIAPFAAKNNGTGILFFLDAKTKKLISKISLAKPTIKIKQVYEKALSGS
jgi:hypothetical protein